VKNGWKKFLLNIDHDERALLRIEREPRNFDVIGRYIRNASDHKIPSSAQALSSLT
jgi:hypothetical protein